MLTAMSAHCDGCEFASIYTLHERRTRGEMIVPRVFFSHYVPLTTSVLRIWAVWGISVGSPGPNSFGTEFGRIRARLNSAEFRIAALVH